jgi:hypothetical protein
MLAAGCDAAQPRAPEPAQAQVAAAWQANQHAVWDLTWPDAPTGGPLTVETWLADGRYRYEILESTAPALIGETLVFDGLTAYRYNRLDPPDEFTPVEARLSPVSDAFARVSARLAQPATAATEQPAQLNGRPVRLIILTFADAVTLAATNRCGCTPAPPNRCPPPRRSYLPWARGSAISCHNRGIL